MENQGSDLTDFFHAMQERSYDPQTLRCYEADLNCFFRWYREREEDTAWEGERELNGSLIAEYLEYLAQYEGKKPSTINRKRISFNRYLEWLKEKGLQEEEAVIPYKSRRLDRLKSPRALSRNEVDQFLNALDQEYELLKTDFRKKVCLRDSVMFELLFYHSLEIHELVSLKVSDVHMEDRQFLVENKKKGTRIEYLYSDRLCQKLSQWMEERKEFASRNKKYEDMLFLTKMGTPVTMKFLVTVFGKYKQLSGITEEATPQFLKHSMKAYAESLMRERGR